MPSHALAILIFGLILVLGCAQSTRPLNAAELDQTRSAAGPNNRAAIQLYQQLRQGKDGNLFFSPLSIAQAFAMCSEGARGQTAAQLNAFLSGGGAAGVDDIAAAYGAWGREIGGEHKDYELRVANALWLQKGRPFEKEFLAKLKKDFDAPPEEVDFQHAVSAAIKRVNDWVARNTDDKIKDILHDGDLDAQTKLVLANAIYFKGTWEHVFKKESTQPEAFHLAGGKEVQAPMMHMGSESFGYAEDDDVQVLEMPYKGRELSMLVILPKKADGLSSVENTLSADKIDGWAKNLESKKVIVTFPKFTVRSEFDLEKPLTALGVTDAFGRRADFSGMDGTHELYISKAIHASFVNVDEQGTEAAAATVIGMRAMAMPVKEQPKVFKADHPFTFVIRQTRTGGVLFMGRLAEPK
jgi:serpin B